MLVKMGVDVSRLNRDIRRILNRVQIVFSQFGGEAIITSTYEGQHSPGSLHYANDAIDFRLPKKNAKEIYHNIKAVLGPRYDVVTEANHLHIEYDPK